MSQNTNRQQTDQFQPKFNLVGFSNQVGKHLLSLQAVGTEAFSPLGFAKVTIKGVNGKGEEGGENPLLKYGMEEDLKDVGREMIVTNHIDTVQKVEFRDLENANLAHQIFYDHRREKPLGYFTVEKMPDGTYKETKQSVDADKPFVLMPSKISKEDFEGAGATIIAAIQSGKIAMREGFIEEIQKNNLQEPNTFPKLSAFIAVFDKYFEPTEENISGIKKTIPELDDSVVAPNKMSVFKDGISKIYNYLNYNGITVSSYAKAKTIVETISGKYDSKIEKGEAHILIKELRDQTRNIEGFYASVKAESDIAVGVDATGTICIVENNNVQMKSGGELYKEELQKVLSPLESNLKLLRRKHDQKRLDNSKDTTPIDDNAVIQAEQALINKAMELASENGIEAEVQKIISGSNGIALSLIEGADKDRMQSARSQAENIFNFIKKATTKAVIASTELTVNGMLTKNGERRRQVSYASSKNVSPLSSKGIDYKSVDQIRINAALPVLTSPVSENEDDSIVVNVQELGVGVLDVYVDKKTGEYKAVEGLNDIRYWNEASKLPRLLSALANLDQNDENLEKKIKDMMNHGSTITKKDQNGGTRQEQTGFGVIAIKKEDNNISKAFGVLLQSLRDTMYSGAEGTLDASRLSEIQEKIKALTSSANRNEQNLGHAVTMTSIKQNNFEKLLAGSFFVAKGKNNSAALLKHLNGESLSPDLKAIEVKSIKDTALVVERAVERIKTMLAEEKNSNVLDVSSSVGMSVSLARNCTLVAENRTTKEPFFVKPRYVPEVHEERTFKEEFNKKRVLGLVGKAMEIDISERLTENRAEYVENKPKYNVSLDDNNDKNDDMSMGGLSLDLAGIKLIQDEISGSTPAPQESQEPEIKEEVIVEKEEEIGAIPSDLFSDISASEIQELDVAIMQHEETDKEDIATTAKNEQKKGVVEAPKLSLA